MKIAELKQKWGAFQFYLVLIGGIGAALYIGFKLGNEHFDLQNQKIASQQSSLQNLKTENDRLTKDLNVLGVELEVAKLTQQQHFADMQKSIEREKALRTQLGFYQQVMAPELNEQGFLIEGFNVVPALSDRAYRFELVLMQQEQTKNTVKGSLQVVLIGSENGKAKQYPLAPLLIADQREKLSFSFKYFQVIAGEIVLPESFVPEQVSVHAEIFQFKRKKGELTTVFDWANTSVE
ncbi:DUF6776 family protein [Paraglaciecola aestuariivivens]